MHLLSSHGEEGSASGGAVLVVSRPLAVKRLYLGLVEAAHRDGLRLRSQPQVAGHAGGHQLGHVNSWPPLAQILREMQATTRGRVSGSGNDSRGQRAGAEQHQLTSSIGLKRLLANQLWIGRSADLHWSPTAVEVRHIHVMLRVRYSERRRRLPALREFHSTRRRRAGAREEEPWRRPTNCSEARSKVLCRQGCVNDARISSLETVTKSLRTPCSQPKRRVLVP